MVAATRIRPSFTRRHVFARTAAAWAGFEILAGCGRARTETAPQPATTQPATVSFLGRAPGVYEQTFVDLTRTFRQRYSTVTVDYSHVPPTDNFDQKYQTLIAAGQQPDVFFSSNAGFKQYVGQGHVQFLDEFVKKDREFKEADYEPYWLQIPRYKGRLSALPYDPGMFVNFVNKSHLQRAGIRFFDTRLPATWEEVLEACKRLVVRDGDTVKQWAIDADFGRAWWQIPRQWGMLDVFDGDEHVLKIDQPAALEALQWLADLRARHRVARPPNAPGPAPNFQAANLSMQIQGVQVVGFGSYRTLEDEWDWVPLPVFQGKRRVAMGLASPNIMGIASKVREASWTLMKFLSGPDAQAICLERGISQPMLKAHRNHPAFARTKPPSIPEVPMNEAPFAVPPPMGASYLEVNAIMSRIMTPVYNGEQTARPAIQAAMPELNKVLADFKARIKV